MEKIYTCLDAQLPTPIARPGQTRLWIVAPGKRQARQMLAERRITFREPTFAGPVGEGPMLASMRRCGLLACPAVFAYPMRFTDVTPLLRVESADEVAEAGLMGDVLAHCLA